MHINPNINILNFLKQVQKCNGEVLFETSEGDRIALKSTLSQYIFFTIVSNPELLQSGTIRFEQDEDIKLLKNFLCDQFCKLKTHIKYVQIGAI